MNPGSGYVYFCFGVAVLLGFGLFWRATGYSTWFLLFLIAWSVLQSGLAIEGFYDNPLTMTYRLPLLIIPIAILSLIGRSSAGRQFMSNLDLGSLTLFHVIRVPVELTLSWLTLQRFLPHEMAIWSGENFDILTGFSAPVVYYLVFVKKITGRHFLRLWNIAGLILLAMPVILALLSLPSRYRTYGFRRPDLAIGHFPYILLPAALVPLAFFAHFASLRRLRSGPYRTGLSPNKKAL